MKNMNTCSHPVVGKIYGEASYYCYDCRNELSEDDIETAEVAEAYDENGNTHYICSICNEDIEVVHEADGPDDYTSVAYCKKHGRISN